MGKRALILGSAACRAEDEAAARALFKPDLVIAVNQAGADYPGQLDAWVSFHPELFPKWLTERRKAERPPATELFTAERRPLPHSVTARRVGNWGGSSGLLACVVAIELKVTHGVLAGIPLDAYQGHYYSPEKPWRDGGNYRQAWIRKLDELGRFRSMSGLTREWLGAPTKEWLAMADAHVPPPVWVEAYNDFVRAAEKPNPPTSITLPAAILPPEVVRLVLKAFDPEGEF